MFAGGSLKKMLKCQNEDCNQKKEISVNMQILEVRDICFFKLQEEFFFQSTEEKRNCTCNQSKSLFTCSYHATSLPEILVIRIQDIVGSTAHVRILPELHLPQQLEGFFSDMNLLK